MHDVPTDYLVNRIWNYIFKHVFLFYSHINFIFTCKEIQSTVRKFIIMVKINDLIMTDDNRIRSACRRINPFRWLWCTINVLRSIFFFDIYISTFHFPIGSARLETLLESPTIVRLNIYFCGGGGVVLRRCSSPTEFIQW